MAVKNFSFSVPCLPTGNNIDELSFDTWLDVGLNDDILPSFPTKSLKQIVSLIQSGRGNEIHIFEWLDALECQNQWDELEQADLEFTCVAVWSSIVCNQTLGDIGLFKIALALDGRTSTIVSQLVDSVFIARKASELDEFVKRKLDWLLLLQKSDYVKLAIYCYELNKTVDDTIRWLRMPQINNYGVKLKSFLCEVLPQRNINDFDDKWLAANFLALHSSQQRIGFLEQFICWFKNVEYGQYCFKFVEQHCLPTQENNYWNRLSLEAQRLVKIKFNLSSYFDLYAISSALYSDEASQELNLTDIEKRQIRSRSMFWSNYSSKFNRVRVLLPDNTLKFIVKRNGDVPSFVTSFNQQVNNECEVYIFELEKIIAVEFLRGALSETRFFTRNDWNSQKLFDSETLSANDIRSMSQQEVHDHLPCWQYFCERLLRIKFKITPNMNIPYFKGLPPDVNKYVEGLGLPTPSKVMMAERRQGLENWVEKFWSLESQTGKFGKQGYSNNKSQLYLAKALMAKQMGDQLEFEQFMTKAAELGSSEAMWQLGKLMLLNPRSDAKTKKLGEEWIAKSSGMGHQNATEICKRYGFKPIVQELSPLDEQDSKISKEEILNCINLLESVNEIEQHKGLILVKNLIQNPLFSSHITDALLSLINLSRNTLIRRDATKLLRTYGDERILWELAIELGRGIPSEQEEAIRIYSSLARKNSDEAILEIRKLVDFAKEYERQSVLLVGLKTLENLGGVLNHVSHINVDTKLSMAE